MGKIQPFRKYRYTLLILVFLLVRSSPHSQDKYPAQEYSRLYRDAEKFFNSENPTAETDKMALERYRKAADILIKGNKLTDTLIDCYLKSGILKISGNQPDRALGFFYQAIFFANKNKNLPDSLLFKPYIYAGSIHYTLNDLDSAVYYYKKAEFVNSEYGDLNESERLFNKFGALYFETGDYSKSISYFEKALSLVEAKKPTNVFFIINYKNNIATAFMKLGRYSEALSIFNELLKYDNPADELLYNTANTYFEMNNYTYALKYLRKIRNMDFEKYISLTKIFIGNKQFDSASAYLEKAKDLYQSKKNFTPLVTLGIIQKYSGDLKAADGDPLGALKDYQSAIISLDPAFTDTAVASNPSSFSGLQNFLFLFDALVAKALTLEAMDSARNDTQYLLQSVNAFSSALALSGHIEKTYFSDDARLFLKTKVNPATQAAVSSAIRLFKKTGDPQFANTAFGIVENSKATVLQAGLKNLELSSIPELPAGLVSEEKKYRTMLARLNVQYGLVKDSARLADLRATIHDTEISLAGVQDRLDENALYHALKFTSSTANIERVKEKLKGSDEAILSYYYTSDQLICFFITQEKTGISTAPLHGSLISTIIALRKELQTPASTGRKYLQEAGIALFQELITPVLDNIKNKKRLVIIPFNEIGYVPFEMLVNPSDGSLMIRNYSISYNYSADILSERRDAKRINYQVLAMAPFSGSNNDQSILPALSYSASEIDMLPGKKLSGPNATKRQFVSLSGQFPIVHLATHAIANDTNLLGTYIEFYGLKNDLDTIHRLYEQEIYTLDMKDSRLVILSACETGDGLLVNGEGILSLSRAFSYAGCKSVVTSLWKADEISTSFICRRLHYYLQKGLAIDVSLQKSKMDYLETKEVEERYKNPAYWANLVLIGDYQPVTKPVKNWKLLFLEVLVLSGIFLFVVWKKLARHKNMPG